MKQPVVGREVVTKELLSAMGLEGLNCTVIDLHFAVEELVIVTVKMFMNQDAMPELIKAMKKYKLVPIDEPESNE